MAMRGNLDIWRNFFGFSHFNIFDIIDNAILVAASDYPNEFNLRRYRIAETLISPVLTPMDSSLSVNEEAFLPTQTTSMDLSEPEVCVKLFDGMDDDGNPQDSGEFKNLENGRPSMGNQNVPKPKLKQPVLIELDIHAMDKTGEEIKKRRRLIKKHTAVVKPNKPSNIESGAARLSKVNAEQKTSTEKILHQKSDKDKLKHFDEATRLEVAKRKLHQHYQEVENAKKQRRIEVVDLHDIPKQGLDYRGTHLKPANHNRHWPNRRPLTVHVSSMRKLIE